MCSQSLHSFRICLLPLLALSFTYLYDAMHNTYVGKNISEYTKMSKKEQVDIVEIETTSSTNDYVKQYLAEHKESTLPLVISTKEQTAGKGQRGNTWSSDINKNIMMSLAIAPKILATEQFAMNQAVSLGVVDFLSSLGIEAKIKWPNDIYVNDKKITGILIENQIRGSEINQSIIGIGLNINQTQFNIPNARPTSVAIELNCEVSLHNSIRACALAVIKRVNNIQPQLLREQYHAHLYNIGEFKQYRTKNGESFAGKIIEVEPSGRIVLELLNGRFKKFVFKEIEYIFACSNNLEL